MPDRSPTVRPVVIPSGRMEAVLEAIREDILTGRFEPGTALVEADLAEQYGTSKTPVREALRMLASRGLVAIVPFKGAAVRVVDEEFVRSVWDVRRLLEPEAVRRSVEHGNVDGLARAAEFLAEADAAEEQGDRASASLLNRRFHEALAAACGNPILIEVLANLGDRAALVSAASWVEQSSWEKERDEHAAILAAAQGGDVAATVSLLEAHLAGFEDRTLARLR